MSENVPKRDSCSRIITRISAYAKSTKAETDNDETLIVQQKMLEDKWNKFQDFHFEILAVTGSQEIDAQHQQMDLIAEVYSETSARLSTLRHKFVRQLDEDAHSDGESASTSSRNHQGHHHQKLPQIKIPLFSGGYTEWASFNDLFTAIVHNNHNISDVERLQYLKASVAGEAERLLRHIPITTSNYPVAIKLLADRYTNKRIIISCLLQTLFEQPNCTESVESVKQLLDTTTETLQLLTNHGREVNSWGDIIVYLITRKLDKESRRQWEQRISDSTDSPTWHELRAFLQARFRMLEATTSARSQLNIQPQSKSKFNSRTNALHVHENARCQHCSKGHPLRSCEEFRNLNVKERRKFVMQKQLCYNCLSPSHQVQQCKSTFSCRQCKERHHSLLHVDNDHQPTATTNSFHIKQGAEQVLLATALISTRKNHVLRALLDQGSQCSFVTEEAVQRMKLEKRSIHMTVSSIGSNSKMVSKHFVEFEVMSQDQQHSLMVKAFILPKLTNLLPNRKVISFDQSKSWNLKLADPTWHVPGHIDLLLGADICSMVIIDGTMKPTSTLLLQNSLFGWILSGKLGDLPSKPQSIQSYHTTISDQDISDQLQRFWQIEECDQSDSSVNELEQFYMSTHSRNADGRYTVRLPFRNNSPTASGGQLGESRTAAVQRLFQMERRFNRDPILHQRYVQFMNEYSQLGHMEPVPNTEIQRDVSKLFYLPHHAVIKETSTSTKLRVVFDGSSKTSTGMSINDTLITGPTLQPTLWTILLRWRKHKVGFCADIEKMYRQIWVHKDDRDFQRIFWRNNPLEPPQAYRLNTITYGTSAAPYLAIRTIMQLATDHLHEYPIASNIVHNDFYVDDVISGSDDVQTAIKTQAELIALFHAGGMELKKWSSNKNEVLSHLPSNYIECSFPLKLCEEESIKTLGLFWHPATDNFTYQILLNQETTFSKRRLLSEASRLYDPLGWVAPVILIPKLLFQKLWILKIDWDEQLPDDICEQWKAYRKELHHISAIQIPRWVGTHQSQRLTELHGFSDASLSAYAAVIYSKVTDADGKVHIHLLTAKTKVAPVKTISLPRLELCGSHLLAKLLTAVLRSMNYVQPPSIHAWCDSKIVLDWLKSPPNRWKTFIANRTSHILSILPDVQFNYVKSSENPADVASRGISPNGLIKHKLWWKGPTWLMNESNQYPARPQDEAVTSTNDERMVHTAISSLHEPWEMLHRWSSLSKLLRITSYCKRFSYNAQARKCQRPRIVHHLTSTEMNDALLFWVHHVQNLEFADEIRRLTSNEEVTNKSKLISLNPFVDVNNLLRVGGRIRRAEIHFDQKHPLILPKDNPFTILLVRHAHIHTLHGNVQLMLSHLRDRYWIINGRSVVRAIIHKCVTCTRYSANTKNQYMADLPKQRITPSKPFTHTSVDYAGPIQLKSRSGRGRHKTYKGYIAIFVCQSSKAAHIELVTDLSSEAFIAAFHRFIGRRGHCTDLYSDCGSNFVGANRILKQYLAIQKLTAPELANEGTTWHFSPPYAPHFNGLAESAVKSTKYHLRRVIGSTMLTYEELSTVLIGIEACLNSRPLCILRDDPSDIAILTPGHFLIGCAPITSPVPNYSDSNTTHLTRWKLVQKIIQDYWNRWSNEYLAELQVRHKWTTKRALVKKDDVVLIKDDNLPPAKWSMARVHQLHHGNDNLVRVVSVQPAGSSSTTKRPISKIIPLPINQ